MVREAAWPPLGEGVGAGEDGAVGEEGLDGGARRRGSGGRAEGRRGETNWGWGDGEREAAPSRDGFTRVLHSYNMDALAPWS